MEACGRERRRVGLREKTEMNCRGAGIFSLQVVHHPGRIWYVRSGKAVLKAMLQQKAILTSVHDCNAVTWVC